MSPSDGVSTLRRVLDELGDQPGIVHVEAGEFDSIEEPVRVPANTWLRGAGADRTAFRFANDVSMDSSGLVRIEGDSVGVTDLELDGNRANVSLGSSNRGQEYGIYVAGCTSVCIERVHCHHFPGYGIDPHPHRSRPPRHVRVAHCRTAHNGLDGITFAGVVDGIVERNVSHDNDRHGINLTGRPGSDSLVCGNVVRSNGGSGVVVQNGVDGIRVESTLVADNARSGIRLGNEGATSESVVVTGSAVHGNAGPGINVRRAESVRVSDTWIRENNGSGETTADVVIRGDGERASSNVRVGESTVVCGRETPYGIDERPGCGPSTIVGVQITGYDRNAVRLRHPDSTILGTDVNP
ncbi:right-handed parallel beta-helix repeat-containing protein [Halovivax cerinus]|uniref:Right-handed parallel beta-helix repeat-containing protein n=1 Tax=Halovivax cerinus TaxID=1487865 RepID=A0ABD5NK77_9EURY|nr:right-handed parallel beta-helix repeat-containing protein [Halovivax cerinus]